MFSRRDFIKRSASLLGSVPLLGAWLSSCSNDHDRPVPGKILGASAAVGHMLRDRKPGVPGRISKKSVIIVGSGVAGLAAARHLYQQGMNDFEVMELESTEGGNSLAGKNKVSAYPWGAHYLPLPNIDNEELLKFLEEAGVITHYSKDGIPFYNEYHLCHDPEERLYIHGQWQEGLVPVTGTGREDQAQIRKFHEEMERWKQKRGKDGKYAFDIPVDNSSQDAEFMGLDAMTMSEWMQASLYTSVYLNWYVDYCCRDDYGTSAEHTSAWAGIHYFASRKGKAANADPSAVLTWPEGNAFLINALKKDFSQKIRKNALVYNIKRGNDKVWIDYINVTDGRSERIEADQCIVCAPQFVNHRLLGREIGRSEDIYKQFTYAPWMIANITVSNLHERRGRPLSWDNVFYQGRSLGYINATHQDLKSSRGKTVFTFYHPLSGGDPAEERRDIGMKGQRRKTGFL